MSPSPLLLPLPPSVAATRRGVRFAPGAAPPDSAAREALDRDGESDGAAVPVEPLAGGVLDSDDDLAARGALDSEVEWNGAAVAVEPLAGGSAAEAGAAAGGSGLSMSPPPSWLPRLPLPPSVAAAPVPAVAFTAARPRAADGWTLLALGGLFGRGGGGRRGCVAVAAATASVAAAAVTAAQPRPAAGGTVCARNGLPRRGGAGWRGCVAATPAARVAIAASAAHPCTAAVFDALIGASRRGGRRWVTPRDAPLIAFGIGRNLTVAGSVIVAVVVAGGIAAAGSSGGGRAITITYVAHGATGRRVAAIFAWGACDVTPRKKGSTASLTCRAADSATVPVAGEAAGGASVTGGLRSTPSVQPGQGPRAISSCFGSRCRHLCRRGRRLWLFTARDCDDIVPHLP